MLIFRCSVPFSLYYHNSIAAFPFLVLIYLRRENSYSYRSSTVEFFEWFSCLISAQMFFYTVKRDHVLVKKEKLFWSITFILQTSHKNLLHKWEKKSSIAQKHFKFWENCQFGLFQTLIKDKNRPEKFLKKKFVQWFVTINRIYRISWCWIILSCTKTKTRTKKKKPKKQNSSNVTYINHNSEQFEVMLHGASLKILINANTKFTEYCRWGANCRHGQLCSDYAIRKRQRSGTQAADLQ